MDDYLKDLLAGQSFPEEEKPEELTRLLDRQGSPRQETKEADGVEAPEHPEGQWVLDQLAVPEKSEAEEYGRKNTKPSPDWEKGTVTEEISALKETASKRFLEQLEREITSLSYGGSAAVVIQQTIAETGEEASAPVSYIGKPRGYSSLSPEGISRVFERDARRYS